MTKYYVVRENGRAVVYCSTNYPHIVGMVQNGMLITNTCATESAQAILLHLLQPAVFITGDEATELADQYYTYGDRG